MKKPDTSRFLLSLIRRRRPLIIGHRGDPSAAPENTLPSFLLALQSGADLIELDFHQSRDGVPVAIHDDTLDRTTDARVRSHTRRLGVAERTAAEMGKLDAGSWFGAEFAGTRVPRLADALRFIVGRGGVPLIEHKSGEASVCARLLRELKLINRVAVMSFDWSYLRAFHQIEPAQILGALGPAERLPSGLPAPPRSGALSEAWLHEAEMAGAEVIVWNRRVSSGSIRMAHRRGWRVWVYTINRAATARRLVQRGVDGIITERIEPIRKALEPVS